jgi:hypothetical protein
MGLQNIKCRIKFSIFRICADNIFLFLSVGCVPHALFCLFYETYIRQRVHSAKRLFSEVFFGEVSLGESTYFISNFVNDFVAVGKFPRFSLDDLKCLNRLLMSKG